MLFQKSISFLLCCVVDIFENMAMYNLELFLISVLITRLSTQRLLDIGDKWTEDEKRTSYSVMRYEFRVTCDAHYYGSGCENLCRPRDDSFGHYNCSSTGSRVCLPGWQGDYCTKRKYLQLFNHQSLNLNHLISYLLFLQTILDSVANVSCFSQIFDMLALRVPVNLT